MSAAEQSDNLSLVVDEVTARRLLRGVSVSLLRREMGRRGWNDVAGARTVDLISEIERRGYIVTRWQRCVELPGLRADQDGGIVEWRGASYTLTPRELDIVLYLANLYPGHATYIEMGAHFWGGDRGARNNASVTTSYIRAKVPGLIVTDRQKGGAPARVGLVVP